jgi:hypothetical protein
VLKQRSGQVDDDEADFALPHWAGLLPVHTTFGTPEPAPEIDAPLPAHLSDYRRP